MERNWANLPPQIFPLIVNKFSDISDFVRSRAVCKPWRYSSSVSNLAPQFPWIIKLGKGPDLEFYSISFSKVYTIHARCSSGKRVFRPAHSYLLSGQKGSADSFSLLNPLDNRDVPLPVLHDCDPSMIPYIFSWFSPTSKSDYYVFAFYFDISVACKPGDDKWIVIGPGHESQYRCFYLKGLLFRVLCPVGDVKIVDICSGKELYVIQTPKYEKVCEFGGPYLAESCGEILAICYNKSSDGMNYKFYIYRLELAMEKGILVLSSLAALETEYCFLKFLLVIVVFCVQSKCFCWLQRELHLFHNWSTRISFSSRLCDQYV